ncbi:MAG: aldo/keto reductase [Candidatus Thorarchaeota archaeon]
MKTMKLGMTGLEVSRVGIGGIPILRLPVNEAIEVIKYSLDLGITFIDTANAYSSQKKSSEEIIGKGVEGRRDQVAIATKSSVRTKKGALKHIQFSLKRLNTDYIDLWQFHGVNNEEAYNRIMAPGGAMEAAKEALETGTIRHIGFSSHAIDIAFKMVESGHFETIQFPFNFVNNEAADKLIPLAKKMNVGFIAMKPFAGGNLRHADLAIKYILQFDNVLPDPGIKSFKEIKEIVDIVEGSWDLCDSDEKRMQDIRDELGTRFCRWCSYCMPCPNKVNIPWLMNVRLVHSYGDRYFNNASRAVDTADNCIQCGECEPKCPYELPIMERIAANAEWFMNLEPYALHSSGSIE